MTEFARIRIADYIEKIGNLLSDNWDEMGFDFPLKVDVEAYKRAERSGFMFAIMGFDDVGEVIGYCSFAVVPHFHNPEYKYANTDTIYLTPPHQNAIMGGLLMRAVKLYAKELGAYKMLWHAKANTPFAAMLREHPDQVKLADEVFEEAL